MDTSVERAHFNMVEQQVRPWGVSDPEVLDVLARVPRDRFVPESYCSLAYADIEIPIAAGQVMLAPKVVGRMLQALRIRPEDRILEIGAGSGYVTGCLASLGSRVVSLELHQELAEQARATLESLNMRHFDVRVGDALAGEVEGNPFDVIAVTGSLPDDALLSSLQDQLALNGRLFAIVGEAPLMEAMVVTRVATQEFQREVLFETSVPALEKVPEVEHFEF